MRKHIARAVVIAGFSLSACGGTSEDQDIQESGGIPPAASPATVRAAGDSAALNSGHASTGDSMSQPSDHASHTDAGDVAAAPNADPRGHVESTTTAPDAHAGHVAAAPAPKQPISHAGHAASASGRRAPAATNAEHVAHSAPVSARTHVATHADSAHAMHAARTDTSRVSHAAHRPDSAHAGHSVRRTDTTHAAHATPPARDTAHAGHAAMVVPDSTHAGHASAAPGAGQPNNAHESGVASAQQGGHEMWMRSLGGGWMAIGMAQAYPIGTTSLGAEEGSSLDVSELYLTQPAIMFNLESPGSRFSLRTTLNFEGITQEDGEVTFGGWGEGFLDRRHPHTLLHEFILSANFWNVAGGDVSVSAGKGFAPYGTDDPMSRPAVKYPTNHHLSQILERWTLNGVYLNGGWSLEAGLFGGGEPEGPYDLSNIKSFGDSWSARVARRFGPGYGPMAETELSASFGRVREVHHEEAVVTKLYNAAIRHERAYGFGSLYGLVEGSMSEPQEDEGYFSILAETKLTRGTHQPYYRIEYATRPEYEREGAPGTEGFFRYDHDSHAIGATRWLINTIGYGYELTDYPVSARPFVEVQHSAARAERGGIEPEALFGKRNFWGVSAGVRIFLGGNPMRMGSYGVLDAMTTMHRSGAEHVPASEGQHTGHQ